MTDLLRMTVARRSVAMVMVAGLVLVGCGSSLAEYREAFEDFTSCVEREGGAVEVTGVAADTGLISYRARPPANDEAALDECHRSEFRSVEVAFTRSVQPADGSLTQEDREFFASTVLPCLEANDVARPIPETYNSPEYREAAELHVDLANRGLCPGQQAQPEGN